jgi:hypothetical protein
VATGAKILKNSSFIQSYLKLIGFITAFLGITLLFWPSQISSLFFDNVGVSTEFFCRITGSTLIGYSVLNLLASHDKNRHLLEFAVWGNLATLSVASLVTLLYFSRFDSNGWLIILQHGFFGGGFVVCALKLKSYKN